MSKPWFRMYAEVLNDPKVQSLPPDLFKAWINILCVACNNNGTLPETFHEMAFALRMSEDGARTVVERLKNAGLIDSVSGGINGCHNAPHGWRKRQYNSDSSTERVKRFRSASKPLHETPPETDTDTDTEREKELPSGSSKKGSRFALDSPPSDWIQFCQTQRPDLNPGMTFDIFKNHWQSKPGKEGLKLDWFKTWQNWVFREKPPSGGNHGKQTKIDLIAAGIAEARAKREQRESGQAG